MRPLYYDRKGQPMEMEEWGRALDDIDGRRIGETTLPDGTWISTVWIGVDHNFSPEGAPLIFETMVFPQRGDPDDRDCERYSTEEQARAGHEAMVVKWSVKQ